MKILMIVPDCPAKGSKGYQIMSYQRARGLVAQGHSVTIISINVGRRSELIGDSGDLAADGIEIIKHRKSRVAAIRDVILSLIFKKTPLQVAYFKSSNAINLIVETYRRGGFDCAYFVTSRVFFIDGDNIRYFIDFIDSMALNYERRALVSPWYYRWIIWLERERIRRYENKIASDAMAGFTVSAIDSSYINSGRIYSFPLGVLIEEKRTAKEVFRSNYICFTGNMSYAPNIEAIHWFINNFWPIIKIDIPLLVLKIAGRNTGNRIRELCGSRPDIVIMGEVDSIRSVISGSLISIAPMISGSGMQIKILEAMSCAVPVVATRIGIGDIKATEKDGLIPADTPDDMVNAIKNLYQDREINRVLGNKAREYVRANHSWNKINKYISEVLAIESQRHI